MNHQPLLSHALTLADRFLTGLRTRPVPARMTSAEVAERLGPALGEAPSDPLAVLQELADALEPGLVATPGPRYFGFVTGGSYPVAVAADWLVSAWDQNAALNVMSPAVAALEDVTAGWLLDLLGLPARASVGFVTGAHMANVTALAAARHEVLRRAGWDVESEGLQGGPPITVVAGAEAHSSIFAACRFVGLGQSRVRRVASDDQGRMRPEALESVLTGIQGPTIVCAQAGNVNTGAFDPLEPIASLAHARDAWLHIDGAFGLWAAVVPSLRHHVEGLARADSWTVDAHKWLNVPYDSGIVCVAHPAAHRAAMGQSAAYLIRGQAEERDGMDWVPESSRRARAVGIYATLRALGRRGLGQLVDGCCRQARRMAAALGSTPGIVVLNDVVLNQVLVRFEATPGDAVTDCTGAVLRRVQREGVCWFGGTTWQDRPAARISVSGWQTTDEDVDRSAASIIGAYQDERAG